jgi:uridine kinase
MLEKLTTKILEIIETKNPNPIILIDGRAGSGKTTYAKNIQNALFKQLEQAPKIIPMDDLYPGWEGLSEGSQYLTQKILQPLKQNQPASWQVFDWATGSRGGDDPGNGWREFDGGTVLIIEGCGSISKQSKPLADIAIWLEADEAIRRSRWRIREGNSDYFSIWAAQEDEFYLANNSASLADYVLETNPE